MPKLNISEIKSRFSATIARVTAGETVIICNRNKPVAEIRPIKRQETFKKRPIGLAGKEYPDWEIGDKFFEPLPEDILAYFTGEKE
jgi:prevent-host-death family protein